MSTLTVIDHRRDRIKPSLARELRAQGLKRCPDCKRDLPLEDFGPNGYCRLCGSKRAGASRPGIRIARRNAETAAAVGDVALDRIREMLRVLHEFRNELALAKAEVDLFLTEFEGKS